MADVIRGVNFRRHLCVNTLDDAVQGVPAQPAEEGREEAHLLLARDLLQLADPFNAAVERKKIRRLDPERAG